jgi:hypothetical protein
MTRDQFREAVFKRDNHRCVICGIDAKDAHHIVERRLWEDGGYHLANGASLCEEHHRKAESTELSCDDVRIAAGITHIVLPEHLYDDTAYDKWGNQILSDGTRAKGELFYDPSVQKVLAPVLHVFRPRQPRRHDQMAARMKRVKEVLELAGIGPEWWKEGQVSKNQPAIFLDLKYDSALSVIEKILKHSGVLIGILTLDKDDNYAEVYVFPEVR